MGRTPGAAASFNLSHTAFPYLEKEDFQAVYEFFASIPKRIAVLEAAVDEMLPFAGL